MGLKPVLGALGPSWDGHGVSRAALGRFGPSWDGLEVVLGRPWVLLGPLGTVLASILGPTNHKIEIQSVHPKSLETFWVDFGAQNGAQNDPTTTPK